MPLSRTASQLSHGSHMASLPAVFDVPRINTLELNIRPIWCQGFPTKQCHTTNTSSEHVCEEAGLFSPSLFSTWFQLKLNTNKRMEAAQLPSFPHLYCDQSGKFEHFAGCSIFSCVTSIKSLWLSFCGLLKPRALVDLKSHHICSNALRFSTHAYCFSQQVVLLLKDQSVFKKWL